MLKRFVSQKPMPPVREEPRYSGNDENNHPANGEEPITTTIIDKPKPMADHGGKDILSSDVEIKGSIKFQKELLIDGKVDRKSTRLNSSHSQISYAVFCLKKKKRKQTVIF